MAQSVSVHIYDKMSDHMSHLEKLVAKECISCRMVNDTTVEVSVQLQRKAPVLGDSDNSNDDEYGAIVGVDSGDMGSTSVYHIVIVDNTLICTCSFHVTMLLPCYHIAYHLDTIGSKLQINHIPFRWRRNSTNYNSKSPEKHTIMKTTYQYVPKYLRLSRSEALCDDQKFKLADNIFKDVASSMSRLGTKEYYQCLDDVQLHAELILRSGDFRQDVELLLNLYQDGALKGILDEQRTSVDIRPNDTLTWSQARTPGRPRKSKNAINLKANRMARTSDYSKVQSVGRDAERKQGSDGQLHRSCPWKKKCRYFSGGGEGYHVQEVAYDRCTIKFCYP